MIGDDNAWNDGAYLLSKDVLFRSAYTLMKKNRGQTQPLQDAFVWDGTMFFSKELALAGYERPDAAEQSQPEDAFLENCRENLAVVQSWVESRPDTQFVFFLSPYSVLYWDKMERLRETDAMFALLDETAKALLPYKNVELQCFLDDYTVISELDNYADHIHVAGRVTYAMAQAMPGGEFCLTAENYRARLDALREFVVNYNYDSIFA